MSTSTQLFIIFGMAIITAIPRVLPLLFLSSRGIPGPVMRVLEMIPPSVLAALLAQEILLTHTNGQTELFLSLDNIFLLALIPTAIVGLFFKNFFITVVIGIASVALLRLIML